MSPATGLAGAAYTNNDLDPNTGTTLFDIDTSLNQVVIQSPPNAGSLVPTGMLTVDTDTPIGFDIYTTLQNGVAINNSGFASLVVGGVPGFYGKLPDRTGVSYRLLPRSGDRHRYSAQPEVSNVEEWPGASLCAGPALVSHPPL